MNRGPLADAAEEVLTDIVLIRMAAHGSILGPYRPTFSLLRAFVNGITFRWVRRLA